MYNVTIDLTNGLQIKFDTDIWDYDQATAFLADHTESLFLIHHNHPNGFDNLIGKALGRSYICNNGESMVLSRSDVVSIKVA